MQFKIREATGFHAATKAIHRRFADVGFLCKRGNTAMDGSFGRGNDDVGDFAFRFAQMFQLRLDLFQHIHDVDSKI